MSYGYGSLRGIVIICLVTVSSLLLTASSALAASPASEPAGGSVTVTVAIAPVRIVVVDDHDRIIEILSNGPSDVVPTVHRGSPAGRAVRLTPAIHNGYTAAMKHIDRHATGVVYRSSNGAGRKPASLLRVAIISTLINRPSAPAL